MEIQRAREIISAPEKIEVHFDGTPVWIEDIKNDTANVTVMGTCKSMEVPVYELQEKGIMLE
ncbi:H-type small acid-soluble spore protein [Candidatus Contubernalis alkaliaceticus]|uniref:H-type small acid-soluble spore protein n=1 Tax=Candidatus Contubernalis alkaliaceticus TaxID=338645 RepID=UPI001F4C4AD5|nr:H-type small acid-soluble spore protein [Candidatus Contubernalis alkalaceticus]UNC91969.1 small, acid-soluble spore protein, H family [Candidatus Contubernalis alkalaceticus]